MRENVAILQWKLNYDDIFSEDKHKSVIINNDF